MSRWWPDAWQFTLAPDSVTVVRLPHRLRLSGQRPSTAASRLVPVAAGERAQPWSAALATLAEILGNLAVAGARRARATVILSNHFVHYALVPWSDLIDGEEEGVALARHFLGETYGAAAERWELRIAADESAGRRLVSAVDPDLLAELRALFADTGLRLVSIQPRLMAVCNRHMRALARGDGWLAVAEPGSLCLALVQGQQIASLRQARLGDAWAAELMTALERESLLAEAAGSVRRVDVAATGLAPPQFPAESVWHIEWLEPAAATAGPSLAPQAGG